MFAERGLAASRLDDIAKHAGLSKGTIYLYFPNKEELFREVVRSSVIAFIARAEEFVAVEPDPIKALERWMDGFWKWLRSPVFHALNRLLTTELSSFPDLQAFYATEVIERAQRLVRGTLERGMDSGVLRRMDPLVASRMLSSLFVMHGMWYHQRESHKSIAHIDPDVLFEQIRDFYFTAMRPDVSGASDQR